MKNIQTVFNKGYQILALLAAASSITLFSFVYDTGVKKEEMVEITTRFGSMVVRLYPETPLHKENFLKLVEESYFDSLLFHRVIAGFMVQGGDPDSKIAPPGAALGMGGPGYTIPAEILPEFIHKKGALSAARQGDAMNPEKESSGSQFYIVQGKTVSSGELETFERRLQKKSGFEAGYTDAQRDTYSTLGGTPHLDGDYTVFGEVIKGLNILDSIASAKVDKRSRPLEDLAMSMKIIKIKWPQRSKK